MTEVRVTWRGKRLNKRTVAMAQAAERLAGFRFVITQGSYNQGGVAASAGTHDGGGALDLRARDLSNKQRADAVLALRKVGFAAWLRTPAQSNWPFHIHAIAIGDEDLSRGAEFQVAEYRRGRNGLKARGRDDGPDGYRLMTWERYQKLLSANVAAAPAPPPNPNTTISLGAMEYARKHDAMNGVWGADRAQVLAWAAHPNVRAIDRAEIRPPTGKPWRVHFVEMTKKVQRKFGLAVDGVFGPVTASVMKRYGYTITN